MREQLFETIRDELAGWPIGSGYDTTRVAVHEAGEMADAVMQMLSERETYVADCCGASFVANEGQSHV